MTMTNAEGVLWKMGEYTNDEETQFNSFPYAACAATPIDIGMNISDLVNSSQLISDADKSYALAMLDSCARRLEGNIAYVI